MGHIAFRVDGSTTIGGGHVVRCGTLADELWKRGHTISFVCAAAEGGFEAGLRKSGYPVASIPARSLAGEGWREDLADTKAALARAQPDLIAVDHYGLDARWERGFDGVPILAIDDLANRPHDCYLLLDQTFGETGDRYDGLVPDDAVRLVGARFCLLRPSFRAARRRVTLDTTSDQLLVHVFFGSADTDNHTLRFSRLILEGFTDAEIRSAIGAANVHRASLEGLRDRFADRFDVQQGIESMADHMAACTVAVGAPGTATWERACLGLPGAYLAISENQVEPTSRIAARGLCRYLGRADRITDAEFVERVGTFFRDREVREAMRRLAMTEIDGCGTERVADAVEQALKGEHGNVSQHP